MDLGPLIVVIIRLIIPFSIFRWPFWGTVTSAIVDTFDVVLVAMLGMGDFDGAYKATDKVLDTYYLAFAFIVSLRWKDQLAKVTSISLFFYRVVGVILFEITHVDWLLMVFPNLFESWFLVWAARNRYFKKFKLTMKKLWIILVILLIPKLIQEYILHFANIHPWEWFRETTGILSRK